MSTREDWAAVDRYIEEKLIGADPELEAALADSDAAGLPPIAVSVTQGKLLHLTAISLGARRILEIGTLGGYSAINLARALPPGGRLISLELSEKHAGVARANIERAGLSDRVEIRVGAALDSLAAMAEEPFDLIFIDADKPNIPAYFDHAVRLSHPGSVIITDNVVRNGGLADPSSEDGAVQGVRAFHEMLAGRRDVGSTTIQTVGTKGWDGYTYSVVR